MSHDEMSGPVTRKERRKAYGERQAAPRRTFLASDYLRPDWTAGDLIEFLEDRARGYNGILRQLLCSSAAKITDQQNAITRYEAAKAANDQEMNEVVHEIRAVEVAPIAPLNISKRNQQPGRLSGSERAALKKFVTLAAAATDSEAHQEEVMTAGRALLTKVRKRALGGDPAPETVMDEIAHYAAFGPDGDGA